MATNINVGANTTQAVGAFDALTRAILGTKQALSEMNKATKDGTVSHVQYAQTLNNSLTGAFSRLQSIISTVAGAMVRLAGTVQLIFNSILKEADKLQGFNAIMSVSTGSSAKARQEFDFLRKTADQLGIQFDALTSNYAKLVAAIPEGTDKMETARNVFLGISLAARTLHATNQDTQLMFYAVTQIASKGVVSMEELRRQLGEKLPGAMQIAARAANTTTDELEKAIRKGTVDSIKFLQAFGPELIRTFAEPAAVASGSISAALNRLTNVWVDFVDNILTSGAGQSIINVFDALRQKLADPYVMNQFSNTIKYIGDRITEFVKNLTKDDIRNGFDSFRRAVEAITTVLGGLISALTWIINNASTVGTIVGGLYGASKGAVIGAAVGGPAGAAVGAGIGFIGGAAGGGYLGRKLESTPQELAARREMDAKAREAAIVAEREREKILNQFIVPLLKLYNLTIDQVPRLGLPENINMKTVYVLRDTLTDKRFKTPEARASAIGMYARTGALIPEKSETTLQDLLAAKQAKESEMRRIQGVFLESKGYKTDFIRDWEDLNTLYRQGAYNVEELEEAQRNLMSKQPRWIAAAREERESLKDTNAAMKENIDSAFKYLKMREEFLRENERYTEDVERARYGLTASNRQLFMQQGLEDFDRRADEARLRVNNPYELQSLNEKIDAARVQRAKELTQLYNEQIDAVTGLKQANVELFDYLENRALQVRETFANFMGGMRSMWDEFVTTGKVKFSDFVRVIQLELAKVTWNQYIAPLAAKGANFLTGALFGGLGFERGGVMTAMGPRPLPVERYMYGGVADKPQVSVWAEGRRPEAMIPLPDGRTVPVTIKGGMGGGDIKIYQTLYVGQGVSRSEVAAAMVASKNAAVSEVRSARDRRRDRR